MNPMAQKYNKMIDEIRDGVISLIGRSPDKSFRMVARDMGISPITLKALISDSWDPDIKTVIKISDYLIQEESCRE